MAIPAHGQAQDDGDSYEMEEPIDDPLDTDSPLSTSMDTSDLYELEKLMIDNSSRKNKGTGTNSSSSSGGPPGAEWFNTYPDWKAAYLGPKWKPVRLLGKGGYGIVGLWKWDGDDKPEDFPDVVVIKQTKDTKSLQNEETFLKLLENATRHVVRMYGTVYTEPPQSAAWTTQSGELNRIFLEFCDQGSIDDLIKKLQRMAKEIQGGPAIDTTHFSEHDTWTMFLHLSRAMTAMDRGNDDITGEERLLHPENHLVHYDLKPANVLFHGDHDDPQRIFKVSDFGLAKWTPPHNQQDAQWVKHQHRRGTRGFKPPEQTFFDDIDADMTLAQNFKIGRESNIWNTGLIMLCIMSRMRNVEEAYETLEDAFYDEEFIDAYSEPLRHAEIIENHIEDAYSNAPSVLTAFKGPLEPIYWEDPLDIKHAQDAIKRHAQDHLTTASTQPLLAARQTGKRGRSRDEEDDDEPANKKREIRHGIPFRGEGSNEGAQGLRATQSETKKKLLKIMVTKRKHVMIHSTATVRLLLDRIFYPDPSTGYQLVFQDKIITDITKTLLECGIEDRSEVTPINVTALGVTPSPVNRRTVEPKSLSLQLVYEDQPRLLSTPAPQVSIHGMSFSHTVWDLAKAAVRLGPKAVKIDLTTRQLVPNPRADFRRAWNIDLWFDNKHMEHSMKTLRSYGIVNNSVVVVQQIHTRPIETSSLATTQNSRGVMVKVGCRAYDDKSTVVAWTGADMKSSLTDFATSIAHGKFGFLTWHVVHVNRNPSVFLSNSLEYNGAVSGCIIDIEGGKEPLIVHYSVLGTTEAGSFVLPLPATLNVSLLVFCSSINHTYFSGKYLRGKVYDVDDRQVDTDRRGRFVSQRETTLADVKVRPGSSVFIGFTRPKISIKYRDANQQQHRAKFNTRMDVTIREIVAMASKRLNMGWKEYAIVRSTFSPQFFGGPQVQLNLAESLRRNGVCDEKNEIEIVDKTKWINGLTIQWLDEANPGAVFSWTLGKRSVHENLGDVIIEVIKTRMLRPWNNFRVAAIDMTQPAASILAPSKRTLLENSIVHNSRVLIEEVTGNISQYGVHAVPEVIQIQIEPEVPDLLDEIRSTVNDLTLEWKLPNGKKKRHKIRRHIIIDAEENVLDVIREFLFDDLGWQNITILRIDGVAVAGFGNNGKLTFRDYDITDGAIIRIEAPKGEKYENIGRTTGNLMPRKRKGPVLQVVGVKFRWINREGEPEVVVVNRPLALEAPLHEAISQNVSQPWNIQGGYRVLLVDGQPPPLPLANGPDQRTLDDYNIMSGSVVVIAPV